MSETSIQALKNGPYLLKGGVEITDAQGNTLRSLAEGETVGLCRCGASAKKPFCDGSHQKVNFQG